MGYGTRHWCEQIGAASDRQQFAIDQAMGVISQALQPPPGAAGGSGDALANLSEQALQACCRARDRRLMPPPPPPARWTLGQLEAAVTEVNAQFTLLTPVCSVDHNALWADFCRLDPDPADGFWSACYVLLAGATSARVVLASCSRLESLAVLRLRLCGSDITAFPMQPKHFFFIESAGAYHLLIEDIPHSLVAMAKADQGGRWSWVDILTVTLGLVASLQMALRWLLALQAWAVSSPQAASGAAQPAPSGGLVEEVPRFLTEGEHHISHGGRTRMHTSNF